MIKNWQRAIGFWFFTFSFSLSLVHSAQAANWYVRSGATGNGTNWTNAWGDFANISWSTVACGDTIWVAGGTYTTTLTPLKACTSGAPLALRRARSDASAATSAAGWSSAFDSTVHQSGDNAEIQLNATTNAFITISGRTVGTGVSANGWYMDRTTTTNGCAICFGLGASHISFEYMDMQGPGFITYGAGGGRAIDMTPNSGTASNISYSHMKIWNWESAIYAVACDTPLFEYIEAYDITPVNWATFHPDGLITWACPNGIFRYSKFHKGPNGYGTGEGLFFQNGGGSTGWQIYGNQFWDLDYSGIKAIEINADVGLIKIFNNTFDNIIVPGVFMNGTIAHCDPASEVRNNLALGTSIDTCGTNSNNLVAASPNVFVDQPNNDYHIVSTVGASFPRNSGVNESTYFTADADGNVFGADGAWDIGAYEYASGGSQDSQAPSVPSGLTASAISSSQINLSWTASTDNVGVVGYGITRNGIWISSVTSGTSYSDSSLTPSTLYSYAITAYDAAGNISAPSTAANATTQAPPGPAWSGILDPSRATDWSGAGVEGGIPSASWTQCGTTIAAYTGTGAAINNAIAACGANQYVLLGPGTFNLSTGIDITKSNVVLRGSGADKTFLVISGDAPDTSCGLGFTGAMKICAVGAGYTDNTANWTGPYAQGTTQITLSNTAGLAAGSVIFLDQADDVNDGWPAAGDLFVCETDANNCSSQGGGAEYARAGRSNAEIVKVKSISGNTVTIDPPITLPNFRSSQSPGAYWLPNVNMLAVNAGIENLSVDYSALGANGIELVNTRNCWVRGVRTVFNAPSGGFVYGILMLRAFRSTVQDNYIFGPSNVIIASYPYAPHNSGSILFQNNIFNGPAGDMVTNGPYSNSVFAYNFFPGHQGPGIILHNAGEMMDLVEGNVTSGWYGDVVHGSHFMETIFRNAMIGHRYAPGTAIIENSIQAQSHNRFLNVIGNIMGDSFYNTYQVLNTFSDTAIYSLGWQGNASGTGTPPADSNVARTLMRWGNWDSVTQATRWCGNSSDTGWSATCGSVSEVPSAIANFSNPIPTVGDTNAGQAAMPASFYLASKPSWFGSLPWPLIGPDVSNGNISNMAGHANLNPAANCYLNVMHGVIDGSGGALNFNADICYAAASGPPNNPPTVATPAAATPNSVTSTTTVLSVLGADDNGESNLTYMWATTGTPPASVTYSGATNGTNAAKNITANFTKAGTYSFQVTIKDAGNSTVTSNVNVAVNQTLTAISVSPASVSVQVNTTRQFTASALDQFNQALTSQPSFVWSTSSGGTINSSGLFTAGSSAGGPFTITAASGGKTGTVQVTVTTTPPPPPPTITVQPQDQSVTVGQTATFNITATGSGLSYQWQYQYLGEGWTTIVGATTNSYALNNVQLSQNSYQYRCMVSNSGGSVNSNAATLAVMTGAGTGNNSLPAIDPADLPSYVGLNDVLSINNYPVSGVTFSWVFGPSNTNPYGAPSLVTAKAGSASFTTNGAKTNTLSSYGLGLGTYQVTVQATDSQSNKSPMLTGTITLVISDFSAVKVYPNPWRSDKHAGKSVTFANLPAGASVKIFTVSGHQAKDLGTVNGSVNWDLTNDSGDKVGSGIYVYVIKDSGGNKVRGKVALVK